MKDIVTYEGLYAVTEEGKVWSFISNKYLKPWLIDGEYECVMLYKNRKPHKFLVHRLVALAYISNPSRLPEVNHKDGIHANNIFGNLEWVTSSQNKIHALKSGRPFGRKKLTEQSVREIRLLYQNGRFFQKELAKRFGVGQTVISDIILFNIWKHII